MPKSTELSQRTQMKSSDSFTLVELLTVMAIISILAALILYAGNGVFIKAERSRASAEIQAMTAGLEGYKTDNGIYPSTGALAFLTNTPYSSVDSSSAAGLYQQSSQIIYQALSGQTNFLDTPVGNKVYMSFKANQLGNLTAGSTVPNSTYVKDPFGNSYGYSTGTTNGATTTSYPYNGSGFFDLWSTGGKTGTVAANTNSWISNWQ